MRICVIGGFSSFAKRGMIQSWLSLASKDKPGVKVTVLLNGDDDFITGTGLVDDLDVQVELFAEGCFCCTLRNALTETLIEERDVRRPDQLLMSASVIADLGQVEGLIRQVMGEEIDVLSIFSLDLENAAAIIDSFAEMVERNVRSADAVMLIGEGDLFENEANQVISKLKGMNATLRDKRAADVQGKRAIFLVIVGSEFPWFP